MAKKIIGIKEVPNSKNPEKVNYTYFYTEPYGDYDVEHATLLQGVSCGSEWSPKELNCNVGDEVEFLYGKGFQDKAVLTGVQIIRAGKVTQEQLPFDGKK